MLQRVDPRGVGGRSRSTALLITPHPGFVVQTRGPDRRALSIYSTVVPPWGSGRTSKEPGNCRQERAGGEVSLEELPRGLELNKLSKSSPGKVVAQ